MHTWGGAMNINTQRSIYRTDSIESEDIHITGIGRMESRMRKSLAKYRPLDRVE